MVQIVMTKKILESNSDEVISLDSESEPEENTLAAGDNSDLSRSQHKIWTTLQHSWNSDDVHHFNWRSQWTENTRGTTYE
jgi:hypothetical protein